MKVAAEPGAVRIRMKGIITERVELDTSQVPPGQPLVIDAGEITHLNSLGVRNWIEFVDQLCRRAPQVMLERLSPMMVFQASMISTFLGRAQVVSYLSPWVCEACDHMLLQAHGIHEELPENIACPKCKKAAMELDSDADAYRTFRYLALQPR